MRASGSASARSSRASSLIEQILARPAGRRRSRRRAAARGEPREGVGAGRRLPRRRAGLAAASTATAASRAATCATRPGSSGRCSKRRSRATSSPTSRSATNRSTAPTRGTTSRHAMRRTLFESLVRPAAHRSRRRAPDDAALAELAAALDRAARRRLGRSLSIREVDAGSCNGCELEIHALNNAFYDLERFGLRFVASPRHADVLLVTGPVTKNMREALSAPMTRRPTRNGWWRSAIARPTAAFSPAAMPASAACRLSCRSISTSPAARRRRPSCSRACWRC